ncbi:conserved exported hypothetical protein [Candidatus Desulfosporosinus infrequens]|uniref:Uncharacterized protein n=1 Tax=Candidatus Desulfosporosinus infrequens TaxID=2043169 RepID=A0A2U3K4F5_9FIRM|nr:conserved exported hypothetical protein [Candidatus Desulfosporosinus infrequens]
MKKLSKKVMAIVGTATLAVGLMAFPVLAGNQQKENGWVGQMQGFMQNNFSLGQHQTLMNSTAMQNLRNSSGMQKAKQTGDVKTMQELMNSDPVVKTQLGQDNLDKMKQFMNKPGGKIMSNGSIITGSRGTMMNGIGRSNMMGSR